MTQSPLEEYRKQTYDKTLQRLKQEQESRETPMQKLLVKMNIQSPEKWGDRF